MKPLASLALSAVAVVITCSCNLLSQEESPQTARPGVAEAAEPHEASQPVMKTQTDSKPVESSATKSLGEETRFYWMSKRTEDKTLYEEAAQYVANLPSNVELQPTSLRFGDWFVLFFGQKRSSDDLVALDDTPRRWAWVVDRERKKSIARGDFEDARPLLQRLVDVAQTLEEGEKRDIFVERLASVVMAIADHSQDNVSDVEGAPNQGAPVLTVTPQKSTLRFYCQEPSTDIHPELVQWTMTSSTMTFERTDARPGE